MDVFDLFAKIRLDTNDYENGLSAAANRTHRVAGTIGSALAGAAKVGAAALGAASTAVGFLSKQALDGYADMEQLVGGVETLFKTSADTVIEYANNAYKTAGLSANQYMETVTSFSASLLQSLSGDTEAAARYADMAITDMADNANKMGTDIEMLQNAYRGFARGNFTMLDNLALGYAGTKEEMERLLADAERLSGVHYDISSYADMVAAIHEVQTEMGITGTTAAEAASTIQGSVSAAKAAWANLLAGLGDENADLTGLLGNLTTSVETAAANVMPRLTQILGGMGQALAQLAPIIAAKLPGLVSTLLPSLVSAGAQLLVGLASGFVSALPQLAAQIPALVGSLTATLSENMPALAAAGTEVLEMLKSGIAEGVPALLEALPGVLSGVLEGLIAGLDVFFDVGIQLVQSLAEGVAGALPQLLNQSLPLLVGFTGSLRENFGQLVDAGLDLILNLAQGLVEGLPALIENIPMIVSNIAGLINDNAPKLLLAGVELIAKLVMGIVQSVPVILENLPQILMAIVNTIMAFNWINLGQTVIKNFASGLKSMFGHVKNAISETAKGGIDYLKSLPGQAIQWGKDMIKGFIDGILGSAKGIINAVSGVASSIAGFLHFSRPDEGPLRDYETWMPDMMRGLAQGITANAWRVEQAAGSLADQLSDRLSGSFAVQTHHFHAAPYTAIAAPGLGASGKAGGDTFQITINGAQWPDLPAAAEYIAGEIQRMEERKRSAYGIA